MHPPLPMPESDFPHAMTPHKTAFVHKAIDAINASLGRVLPDDIVAVVEEFGFGVSVFGYHELIVINLVLKVFVIEIVSRVHQWFLVIGFGHHFQESDK